MEIKKLALIVGDVLNIHEDPISDEHATIELTMKELLSIVQKYQKENSCECIHLEQVGYLPMMKCVKCNNYSVEQNELK